MIREQDRQAYFVKRISQAFHASRFTFHVLLVLLVAGCRTAAQKTQIPRVDLQLTGEGNRGYLIGTPPPPGQQKVTREMFGLMIELPNFSTPGTAGVAAPAESPKMSTSSESGATYVPQGPYDRYAVQKGDSLWSIAAKPEIYGSATGWRKIFDANRELLKSPDRVRPGMTLRIPRGKDSGAASHTGGTVFKK